MDFYEYFQSFENYFWQWEENMEVIAIPNESTIAYREFIIEVWEQLMPQGIPPFGALLLAIIATNPNADNSLSTIHSIISGTLNSNEHNTLTDAISFLNILSELPPQYKSGKKRILLLQTIFEECHNIVSFYNSKKIIGDYNSNKLSEGKIALKKKFSQTNFNKDFRTISLLKNKFANANSIIEKMGQLPNLEENAPRIVEIETNETNNKDFIEQLIDNNKTFYVGSLVKRIWSGLNIPVHSALPSQQPLGGISDLTNKGDFDKLLISEFANDDLVFLSRLANNEALYIQREIPPANNNMQRVILIDVSLKNWGTPKSIAFALMVAISKHPKTDIICTAFAIGNSYYTVSINTVDSLIDGLQILEGSLHAADGLHAYFKEFPPDKNREIFFITAASTFAQVAMQKALNDYRSSINYWIYTDADGNIDIYKKQQNSKKHIQHIQLPLEELWKREIIKNKLLKTRTDTVSYYPILFRNATKPKKVLFTSDDEIFQITSDKALLKKYNKSSKPNEKGWDFVCEELPFVAGDLEIGITEKGECFLLMFNKQNKELFLFNTDTNENKKIFFDEWVSSPYKNFIFLTDAFYYLTLGIYWQIKLDGNIIKYEKEKIAFFSLYREREMKLLDIAKKYPYALGIFKNINHIYINTANNLVFNVHELHLNQGQHIKLGKQAHTENKIEAKKSSDVEFEFDEGSTVQINRNGMLVLKSSNNEIPFIYIPSIIDASLGAATENEFAGNEYYFKEPQFEVILKNKGSRPLMTIRKVQELLNMGLGDAKMLVESAPEKLISCSKEKAKEIELSLKAEGAEVEIVPLNESANDMTIISTNLFMEKYIQAFIKNILAHGTKN